MPQPAFEIEVIELTGNSIDEIEPEEDLPPLPTHTISELSQALFDLPSTMPWFSFGWLRDLVQGHGREPSPPAAAEEMDVTLEDGLVAVSPAEHAGIAGEPSLPATRSAAEGVDMAARGLGLRNELAWIRDEWAPAVSPSREASEDQAFGSNVLLSNSDSLGSNAMDGPRGRSSMLKEERERSPSVEFLSERKIERAASPPAQVDMRLAKGVPTAPRYMLWQRARDLAHQDADPDEVEEIDRKQFLHSEIRKTAARATARFGEKIVRVQGSRELVMYTDGSIRRRSAGGAGVAYRDGTVWAGVALALGQMSDPTDAEMAGIFRAMVIARKILRPDQRRVVIVTDSASAIKWMADDCQIQELMQPTVAAALKEQERFAEEGIAVEFRWVKGHANTEGNHMADKLAGFGSTEAFKGLMHTFKFPDVAARFGAYVPEGPGRMTPGERRDRKVQMRLKMLHHRGAGARPFGSAGQDGRGQQAISQPGDAVMRYGYA